MSIEVILDVNDFNKEMEKWLVEQGCKPVQISRFGNTLTSYSLNNCKPFHYYQNGHRQVRMFFWRKDQSVPLMFMMRFPESVFSHNMETTFNEQVDTES